MDEKKFPLNMINTITPALEQDVLKKPIKVGQGPEAFLVVEWNRNMSKIFDKGNPPRQGRRYCLKCIRYDGRKGYFGLERI